MLQGNLVNVRRYGTGVGGVDGIQGWCDGDEGDVVDEQEEGNCCGGSGGEVGVEEEDRKYGGGEGEYRYKCTLGGVRGHAGGRQAVR